MITDLTGKAAFVQSNETFPLIDALERQPDGAVMCHVEFIADMHDRRLHADSDDPDGVGQDLTQTSR